MWVARVLCSWGYNASGDLQSKRAWAEGDADDAGHAEKELEIMKSIRRMTSERSKSQWKVGITAAIARAAEAIPDANGGSEGTVPGGENTASAVNGDSSSMLAEKEMKPMPSLLLRMFSKK